MASAAPGGLGRGRRGGPGDRAQKLDFHDLDGPAESLPRRTTGIAELDRVCGSGLVAGSAILIGGDPGIGKTGHGFAMENIQFLVRQLSSQLVCKVLPLGDTSDNDVIAGVAGIEAAGLEAGI